MSEKNPKKKRPVPAHLTPVKQGQVLNPLGINNRSIDGPTRTIKKLSKKELRNILRLSFAMNAESLEMYLQSEGTTAFQAAVCSALQRAIKYGDWKVMDLLLDRAFGKEGISIDYTMRKENFTEEDMSDDELDKAIERLEDLGSF